MNNSSSPRSWESSRLSDDQVYGTRVCVKCSRPAETWCPSCAVYEVGNLRVFYCSPACRGSHNEEHQGRCLALRRLGRAIYILDELWTAFEVATSTDKFRFVYGEGQELFTEDVPNNYKMCCALIGKSIFSSFYTNPLVEVRSATATRTMLFHNNSAEPFTTGLPLVKLILGELGSMGKMYITPKDPVLSVRQLTEEAQPPAANRGHGIIVLNLKGTRNQYIVDLTGAQFGWEEIIYPHRPYFRHRCQSYYVLQPINDPQHQQNLRNYYSGPDPDDKVKASQKFREAIIAKMVNGCVEFLERQNATMASLLTLPEEHYVQPWRGFVQTALDFMEGEIRDMYEKGIGRQYLRGGKVKVALTEETAAQCRELWIDRSELQQCGREDRERLLQRWSEAFPGV